MDQTFKVIIIILAAVAFLLTFTAMRKARTKWVEKGAQSGRERAAYIVSVALLLTVIALLMAFRQCGVF